jgi:hypothetical protein
MIISRTPFRVSFFGGGTDYPDWYREHGGAVLATTIDKYCYISVRELPPFFEHKFRVVYSLVENVQEVGEINHPAVRAVLQRLNTTTGLEIHHDGDLPARSGLGSSSAFTVGLLSCASWRAGTRREGRSPQKRFMEHALLKEPVGFAGPDFGGLRRQPHAVPPRWTYEIRPMIIPRDQVRALQTICSWFSPAFRVSLGNRSNGHCEPAAKDGGSCDAGLVNSAITVLSSPTGDLLISAGCWESRGSGSVSCLIRCRTDDPRARRPAMRGRIGASCSRRRWRVPPAVCQAGSRTYPCVARLWWPSLCIQSTGCRIVLSAGRSLVSR